LHILLISRCPPYPLHLGDRLIVWHLVRELGKLGITFDLIALTQKPSDAEEQHHYAHLFRKITLIPETPRTIPQYLYRVTPLGAFYPEMARQAWSPTLWQSVHDHLADAEMYDGVHVFGGIQVYEVIKALKGFPAIITPYESFALYMARQVQQNPSLMNRVQEVAARAYERWMYSLYKSVIVLAEPDAAMLRELSPGLHVDVIPNGIDLEYFIGERATSAPHSLLFVGNYEYGPNVEAALLLADQIFPQIRAAIPDATLSLVGNAPPPELIAKQGNGITVTGSVPDIREAYAGASVFVSPLVTGAGIKNKVLEALAMRLPVVATPLSVDGIAVENGKNVLITPIEGMAEMVIALLRDEDQQRRLGQQGRALIEAEYSWGHVAAQYRVLYKGFELFKHRSS
jgi:polysaccharide biosynthesis protein PslH